MRNNIIMLLRSKLYLCILLLGCFNVVANDITPDELIVFKKTEKAELKLHVFYPKYHKKEINRTVVVSFFGGGWTGGTPKQFYQQSDYFMSRGIVAISAEYRVKSKHGTSPFESVEDAKSAIRWVRKNAKRLGINPDQIIAMGGSAGGHIAACTALIEGNEAKGEDLTVSSKPNGMVLMNPVLDTTTKGYGWLKVKGRETEISPCHQVKSNMPPSIVFHGTEDKTVPYENAQRFVKLMRAAGNDCQLISAVGKDHGFFNGEFFRKKNGNAYFKLTMYESDLFFQKYNWLKGEPNIKPEDINVSVLGGNVVYGSRINSESYHEIRRGLKNSQIRFTRTKKGTVAFLGGSITYNKGWRNKVGAYLQERFPETKFKFIAAGIPSEGSTSGAFRLMKDILSKGKVDLLFEEAAVNDRSPALRRNSNDRVRGMEGIVRHSLKSNPNMDIVMMHFVDPSKMKEYNQGKIPQEILDHDGVAQHYNITSINLAKEVTERINAGEFNWKDDFKNLHPSPFGQNIYFQSMRILLANAYKEDINNTLITAYKIPEKLNDFSYDKGRFISFKEATFKKGWEIDASWEPIKKERVRKGYTKIPLLVATEQGKVMKLKFKGTAIGMVALSGPDAGMIAYAIDGGNYKTFDLFTTNSPYQHLPRYFMLNPSLEANKEHTLKIKVLKDKNTKSLGNGCRIYSFFAN